MKKRFFLVLLLPVFWGCSPKDSASGDASSSASAVPRVKMRFVESAEIKDQNQVKAQARALFKNKDYAALERLAAQYRTSKEGYSDGFWKLPFVYIACEVQDDEPLSAVRTRLAEIDQWIKARPRSVMPRLIKARTLIDFAWRIRGGGWARSVTEGQWQGFHQRLTEAAQVLEEANKLQERCPLYWSAWMRIATGLSVGRLEYDTMFHRAIQEFPDYTYYYQMRAIHLLPRWHGKEGEWQKDLGRFADDLGGEKGDMMYARVVAVVRGYGGGIEVFEGKRISWERVDRGFAATLKRFPDSVEVKNQRAFLAVLARDKQKALQYFADTGGEADESVWGNKQKLNQFLAWTYEP